MQKCAVVVKNKRQCGYITDVSKGAMSISYTDWLCNAKSLPRNEAYKLVRELKTMGFYAFVIIKNIKENTV